MAAAHDAAGGRPAGASDLAAARRASTSASGPLRRIVVAGAGLAGLRAAEELRAIGFDGQLDVVGAEPHMPYTRPPLSKAFLLGDDGPESCALAGADALDARWHLGGGAAGLDLRALEVVLADGERLPFDGLVIATGSDARAWPAAEPPPRGVLTLRGLDDAEALRRALRDHCGSQYPPGTEITSEREHDSPRVLVVGAGFIGGEVASSARALGAAVTLVELEAQPLQRLLGPAIGELLARSHREHGVDVRLGTTVEAFLADPAGALTGARLSDGTTVAADVCVLALGAVPSTGWLAGSGLPVERGVLCDADLAVQGADRIVAAGDVARWPHPLFGDEPLNVGHWTNAAEQGAHAARTLLARAAGAATEPFADVPTFWSTVHDLKLRSVGLPGLGTKVRLLEGSLEERRCVVGHLRDGHLVGALAVNLNRRVHAYRELIGKPLAVEPAGAASLRRSGSETTSTRSG